MIYFTQNDKYSVKYPFQICLNFIQRYMEGNMKLGRYELEQGIYCSVLVSSLAGNEEFYFEAHRRYVDLHYVLEGTQRMWIGDIGKMEFLGYAKEKDFVKLAGEHQIEVLQTPGTAIAVFPEDAHALAPDYQPEKPVKKIIFKIPLELFEGEDH